MERSLSFRCLTVSPRNGGFAGTFLLRLAAGSLVAVFATQSLAHDDPQQIVAVLTAAIERRGPSPELLYRRACEQRILGELEAAENDLAAAVDADPAHFSARLELAKVRIALGRTKAARSAIDSAEPFAETAAEMAECRMVRCELEQRDGNPTAALAECDAACRLVPSQTEWMLVRDRLQAELGRHVERVRDLTAAAQMNPSAAISIALIEAKIDAGQNADVLPEIESQLASSRWRASWLLRRGRVLLALGRVEEATRDLRLAVEEIDIRLDPNRPDVGLLLERAFALMLLGEDEAATADLKTARSKGADLWTLRQIELRVKKLHRSRGPAGIAIDR